jgi:hypothetical protein
MTQTAADIEALIRSAFTLEPSTSGPFAVSKMFRDEQNHPAGIRAPHAIEAMKDAQSVDRWTMGEGSSVSIALAAGTETRPYAALITAVETPTISSASISQAWRLYGTWPDNPTSALAAFVARFGLEVVVGGSVRGLFVATFTGESEQMIGLANEPRTCTMSVLMRKDGNTGPLEVQWAYAIDDETYRSYVNQNR